MMKTQPAILSLLALPLLLLAACDNDTGAHTSGEELAVQFKSENIALTETRTSAAGDTWTIGDQIGIYMMTTGEGIANAIAGNIAYQAESGDNATTSFTPVNTPETIYYPQTGTTDYIAYYPRKATGTGANQINNHLYPVNTSIQTDPAAIDLLYSNNVADKARSRTEPVALKFRHALSKITLHITKVSGMAGIDFTGMTVSIEGLNTTATFNLGTGDMNPSATPTAITPRTVTAGTTYDAIVIPQTSSADAKVTFTINGVAYIWNMGSRQFDAASEHVFSVTVDDNSVRVTSEIVTWATGTIMSGDASMRIITYDLAGGTGSVTTQIAEINTQIQLPDGTGITPPETNENKIFGGWITTADYSGDYYAPGASMTVSGNLTLYAIWSGDGSTRNPILIFDEAGLRNVSNGPGKEYALCKDIWVGGIGPIINNAFTGKFDGKGHLVTHGGQSLFERIEPNGEVRNVGVEMRTRTQGVLIIDRIAGIASEADGARIENCYVNANLEINPDGGHEILFGGIVGIAHVSTTIRNCFISGDIIINGSNTVLTKVGGIVGECGAATIQNCVALYGGFTVSGGDVTVGRIAAALSGGTTFHNNYGRENMAGGAWVWMPGLSGKDGADCDAYPNVQWWTNPNTWNTTDGGSVWDFTNIWEMGAIGYPKLRIIPLTLVI